MGRTGHGVVRPLAAQDGDDVRALFVATAALGTPLVLPEEDLEAYTALCLGYYLEEDPRGCAVHVQEGRVTGYVLLALDHAAFLRWGRPQAVRWAARAARRSILGAATGFHRQRLLDGLVTLRAGVVAPMPAHAHVNVAAGARGLRTGFALIAHADAVVADAGLPGYFGEVNVPRRKPGRAVAIRRMGGVVVHSQLNRTMSWLAGQPVDRLTVVRTVGPAGSAPPPRSRA